MTEYQMMAVWHRHNWCWWCGRDAQSKPEPWGGPWLIERAHIVASPRREDVRAVVLLCSLCHRLSHGLDIKLSDVQLLPAASVANMLWLKQRFDSTCYDRKFLQENCIGNLPNAVCPSGVVVAQYSGRQGSYPNGK